MVSAKDYLDQIYFEAKDELISEVSSWKLIDSPYKNVNNKKFPSLKKSYSSIDNYNKAIKPLLDLETKEPFRAFNKDLNENKINFYTNAVKIDVKNIERKNYDEPTCRLEISMPAYFLMGYDGMNFNQKNKQKRSSGKVRKDDLLYIARFSKDFKTKYYENVILFDKVNYREFYDDLSDDLSSDSSTNISIDDDFGSLVNFKDWVPVYCKCDMNLEEVYQAESEIFKERTDDDIWICYHIMSFGSVIKEYKTLKLVSRGYLNICKTIASGKCIKNNESTEILSDEFKDILNQVVKKINLNKTQINILTKVYKEKFSLIQGPPGTGKTTMLLAFVYLHLIKNPETKVLVCAPSNYACDEIFKRLIKEEKKTGIKAYRYVSEDSDKRHNQKWDINEADVIISTLCSSGNKDILKVHKKCKFSLLLIDEACQATELSTLIPFCYNIEKTIMIGDPQQLPPTILNRKAERCNYGRSFFQRIMECSPKNSVYLLDTQYRMHPNISKLSSKCFYSNKIRNGENVQSKGWIKEWNKDPRFKPVMFYNIEGDISSGRNGNSICNETEATQIKNYISQLVNSNPRLCFSGRISIISPYRAQVVLIKKILKECYEEYIEGLNFDSNREWKFYDKKIDLSNEENKELMKNINILDYISVSTIDSYQGQENDIVILSCVRSNTDKLGFLRDERRLNVSITRSRHSLIIFGNASTLCQDKNWNNIIKEIKQMGCFKKDFADFRFSPGFPKKLLPQNLFDDDDTEEN